MPCELYVAMADLYGVEIDWLKIPGYLEYTRNSYEQMVSRKI